MNLTFTPLAWEDYIFWQETDSKKAKRLNELLKNVTRTPFSGLGKPEPLKFDLAGCWSRRIDQEHRLVYQVANEETIVILSCRYHY
jgi:toxin YoeB